MLALTASVILCAAPTPSSRTSGLSVQTVRADLERSAAQVATIARRHYPYGTAYRLMRAAVERNEQAHQDSDAFLVGAHLAIAFWISALPTDVPWRNTALARHTDILCWRIPHVAMGVDDIARIVATAEALPASQAKRLQIFIRDVTQQRCTT